MKPIRKKFVFIWLLIVVLTMFIFLIWNLLSHTKQSAELARSMPLNMTSLAADHVADTTAVNSVVPEQYTPLSDRIVEYHMDVELLTESMSLQGTQTLTWTNPGQLPVSELYFHLYPNAFESRQTTFMQESGGKLRNDRMKDGNTGQMQIVSIRTASGQDLTSRMQFVQPDDGNPHDRTLMKLTLPATLDPGGSVTLLTQFVVKLPEAFARMGYVGDYVLAGQWFPKVAAYELVGTRGIPKESWNLHQYHGNSEFYANFGIFDVKIKVPATYTVAATGFPVKTPTVQGESKIYHFYADDVHDFSWAASPHFIYVEEPFSAPNVPGVKIKLYLDPAHESLKNRYLLAAKKSLTRFSEWMGEYPYSTLSIVVPPAGGNGTGGMEYPTLITAWAASEEKPGFELERVLVHEIGHQYWYGMVATNEFEEAWLDEGFTSYIEDKLMIQEYGVHPNLPIEASYVTNPAPLNMFAWNYRDHQHYADNVYTRAKLVMVAIEHQIGEKKMKEVLHTYFQRWKFAHPGTRDFKDVLEEVTGQAWDLFFEQHVYGEMMIDYAVEDIQVHKVPHNDGFRYEHTVVIKNRNASKPLMPVQIRFQFADGSFTDHAWDGKEELVRFNMNKDVPLQWVMIDPEHQLILENVHMNNFMRASIDDKWAVRWNLGIVKVIETLISRIAW